jgi:tetratricopeptide (TPR) repeat protein
MRPTRLLVLSLLLLPSLARAEDRALAKKHFDAGTAAFDVGEFAKAIDEFRASYEAAQIPSTLYALAQAQRKNQDYEGALHSYELYLERSPKGKFRPEAQGSIDEIKKLLDERKRVAELQQEVRRAPPPGVPSSPEEPRDAATPAATAIAAPQPARRDDSFAARRGPFIAALTLSAVGIVGVVTGGALLGRTAQLANEAAQAGDVIERDRLVAEARTVQAPGIAVLAVGGAAVVGGVVAWTLFGVRRAPKPVAATLSPLAGGAYFSLGGRW